jgi:hypothetical protein
LSLRNVGFVPKGWLTQSVALMYLPNGTHTNRREDFFCCQDENARSENLFGSVDGCSEKKIWSLEVDSNFVDVFILWELPFALPHRVYRWEVFLDMYIHTPETYKCTYASYLHVYIRLRPMHICKYKHTPQT